jgi:transposase
MILCYTGRVKERTDFRSIKPEAQEVIRIRAVAVVKAGMMKTKVAEIFGVSRRAISSWMRADRLGGEEALKAKPRGRHRGGGKLKPWQCATIVNLITDRHPDQLKLPFYLWTRQAVGQLIQQRFGIHYSVHQVGRYLKQWGFTVQKPGRKAFEQCPQGVKNWVEHEYPAIQKLAKTEHAEIQWCDEMGVRSDASYARCFSPRGQTPIVPGKRFGCSMISSISNRGTLRFMVFTEQFTTDVMLRFLKRLLKQMPRKIFLIVDGHPVHRSGAVKKFVAEKKDQIHLFHLPSYSPELNPDEMLNQDVKTNAVRRKPATSQDGMVGNIRSYLHSRQRRPELVKHYFLAPSVRYTVA